MSGVNLTIIPVGTGVAKRRERNEWHHGVMSERERDRAAARQVAAEGWRKSSFSTQTNFIKIYLKS